MKICVKNLNFTKMSSIMSNLPKEVLIFLNELVDLIDFFFDNVWEIFLQTLRLKITSSLFPQAKIQIHKLNLASQGTLNIINHFVITRIGCYLFIVQIQSQCAMAHGIIVCIPIFCSFVLFNFHHCY